ncbi:MAG: chemotaxis protein [Planctomycetota bacterium]
MNLQTMPAPSTKPISARHLLLGKDILLDAGTNELEILVFHLDGGSFGVNVAKVREVITPLVVHRIPASHPSVEGAFRLREKVVPLIGLREYLGLVPLSESQRQNREGSRIIITEFNQTIHAFRVDAVDQIHKVSWELISPMPRITDSHVSPVTSIAKVNDKLVPMLDFEMIIDRIQRMNQLRTGPIPNRWKVDRGSKHVAIAEDSHTVHQLIVDSLKVSGYTHVHAFTNGHDLWSFLESRANEGTDLAGKIDIVISDIEMPRIDGLHVTKKIREHHVLKDLPVVLFSSLITPDNLKKGQAVGATAQISKPQLHTVVDLIDEILAKGGRLADT